MNRAEFCTHRGRSSREKYSLDFSLRESNQDKYVTFKSLSKKKLLRLNVQMTHGLILGCSLQYKNDLCFMDIEL